MTEELTNEKVNDNLCSVAVPTRDRSVKAAIPAKDRTVVVPLSSVPNEAPSMNAEALKTACGEVTKLSLASRHASSGCVEKTSPTFTLPRMDSTVVLHFQPESA
jgi:hypothetical protein